MLNHRLAPRYTWLAAIAVAALSGGASAQTATDHYWGQLEYFFPTIASTARLDFPGTNVQGTEIHLEDDLGLTDRKGTPYFLLGTRFGQNWRMEFEYYYLDRSASRTLTRDIEWGGVDYPISATVNSEFNSNIYRLTGGWSFYHTPVAEAGVSLGLHTTDFKLALSGANVQTESRSVTVPLPTLGLYGVFQVAPQWWVNGRVDWLSLTYEKYHGQLTNLVASGTWRFTPNWGVGAGYRYVNYQLTSTSEHFHGEATYEFSGPTLFVQGAF
jgi:hypothetical protein